MKTQTYEAALEAAIQHGAGTIEIGETRTPALLVAAEPNDDQDTPDEGRH